jgi:hypothetical protein
VVADLLNQIGCRLVNCHQIRQEACAIVPRLLKKKKKKKKEKRLLGMIWSEALTIFGIYKYAAILMKFRNIMVRPGVLLNFFKPKKLKN